MTRSDLPTFVYQGVLLNYADMTYNPCDDLIFPTIFHAQSHLQQPLARYYMYYGPHNAPGGICLATADSIPGPWTEYPHNSLIERVWLPHYEVSHIASPHALWQPEMARMLLYYHGENDTTRIASSTDGIHFTYEGIAVDTGMYQKISEASYARVFPCDAPGHNAAFVMLFMGNNRGTRRIYAAWSRDGLHWEPQLDPIINLPPGTSVTQVGAPWYTQWQGKHCVLFHGDITDGKLISDELRTNIYMAEVGAAFDQEHHLGKVFDRAAVGEDNMRASDPCLVHSDGETYLLMTIGARLHQKIAYAKLV